MRENITRETTKGPYACYGMQNILMNQFLHNYELEFKIKATPPPMKPHRPPMRYITFERPISNVYFSYIIYLTC